MGRIIPTDIHIFQRGWNHQPVIMVYYGSIIMVKIIKDIINIYQHVFFVQSVV